MMAGSWRENHTFIVRVIPECACGVGLVLISVFMSKMIHPNGRKSIVTMMNN
jgi:hypothetical protein